jgi:hypothetical protein
MVRYHCCEILSNSNSPQPTYLAQPTRPSNTYPASASPSLPKKSPSSLRMLAVMNNGALLLLQDFKRLQQSSTNQPTSASNTPCPGYFEPSAISHPPCHYFSRRSQSFCFRFLNIDFYLDTQAYYSPSQSNLSSSNSQSTPTISIRYTQH